ncbi:MAG: Ig-like domain-containing protein, partial [Elusimicrobia bacterium]|nr:Ig-like domain-containing protein [Elusimicrobiota bacterium]
MSPRLRAVRAFAVAASLGLGAPPRAGAQCLTAGPAWRNTPFDSQAAPFGATFDATPGGARIDGVTGLSLGAAADYKQLAAIVRFNNAGLIDARNGGVYAADARVPYTAGSMYRFRLAVDPVAHRYSVYVTPPGAAERLLGMNYAFRAEQALAASLNSWALQAGAGAHQVCRFALTAAPSGPDAVPPAVALTSPAHGAVLSGEATVSAEATDAVAVAGVQFLLDGANLNAEDAQAPYRTAWNTAASADGAHLLAAVARDAAGNRATSAPVTVSVKNAPSAACLASSPAWRSTPFPVQSGPFEAAFTAIPAESRIDAIVGLSRGPATRYSDLAAIVRFNNTGYIDARNGGAYGADSSFPYTAGASYRFRLAVDPAAGVYSAYVTPPGSPERTLASRYAFRAEQSAVARLDSWALQSGAGSHRVCAFAAVPAPAGPALDASAPTVAFTAPAASATVSGSVTLAVKASDDAGVAGVQFRVDGVDLGAELRQPPFSMAWDSTSAPNGAHRLTATARDAAGNRTSASIGVVAANATSPAGADRFGVKYL